MESIELTNEQKELIERLGVNSEKEGMPPAPSRVLALLMVSPEIELTFDQIREVLHLSKSATSNAINMLLSMNRIDYITHSGDRKRYFKNRIGNWRANVKGSLEKITNSADLLEEILEHRPETTPVFNQDLKDIISFMRYLNRQLPTLYKNWEEENK